jgi:NADP-dependent 3-hydroxy acid dehydrogenase YdfG
MAKLEHSESISQNYTIETGPAVWVATQAWCRAFAKSLTQTIKASPGVGEKVSPGLVSEPGSGNTQRSSIGESWING